MLAGFTAWRHYENDIRGASQRAVGTARDGEQTCGLSRHEGQDAHDLFGCPTVRQNQHNIRWAHSAQIPVNGLGWMKKMGSRSRGRKRSSDFFPNETGFANAANDQAAAHTEDLIHRHNKIFIDGFGERLDRLGRLLEYFDTSRKPLSL